MRGNKKGSTKEPRWSDETLRKVLAENVRRRMEARYLDDRSSKTRKLARESGVSLSTVQRLVAGYGTTLDTIAAVARVFRTPAHKFLIPADEETYFIDAREIMAKADQPEAKPALGHKTVGGRKTL